MKKTLCFKSTFPLILITLFLISLTIHPSEAQQKDWPKGINFGGGNLGSVWQVYGGTWARIIFDNLHVPVQVEVTQGPSINMQLCQSKQTDIIAVTMAIAAEGYLGIGWARGTKYNAVRSMFPMYPSYLQWWVLAKSDIKSIHDLNGKTIALSGAGSTPDVYCRRMFQLFNIKPKRIVNGGFGDANNMLRDGMIDASAAFGGAPHTAVLEMQSTHEIRILGVSRADAEKFVPKNPGLSIDVIPAGTFAGHDKPIETLSVWNVFATHKDMQEDFVNAMIKVTFAHRDSLIAAFKDARLTTPENITKTYGSIPLHVGAVKFYKEMKIPVPESELPPEYKK